MPAFPNIFNAWRTADGAARAAETAVLAASLQALEGRGHPPPVEDRERAKQLRNMADALLQSALAEMRVQSESRPGSKGGDREGPESRPKS